MWRYSSKTFWILAAALSGSLALAQRPPVEASASASQRVTLLRNVGIDQKLNDPLPLETMFTDEHGHQVRLGSYFNGKPVLLALVYYQCPMLCDMVLNGAVGSLNKLTLNAGEDYQFIAVSFDPTETYQLAFAKKQNYLEKYNRKGGMKGFHFLTGKPDAIKAITSAVGFRYAWDPLNKQFAHASGIMVVTPEGRLSRYFYGIQYPDRDLRLGLVEASHNKIGNLADQVQLFCYHYNPVSGKYGLVIQNIIKIAGAATAIALGTLLFILFRYDGRRHELEPKGSS